MIQKEKPMNEESKPAFDGWAIVELFGHNRIAGYVTEVAVFGTSMMRVDVPTFNDQPGYTKFFGGAAVYAITPTTEAIATEATKRLDVRPVANWIVPDPQPKLPPRTFDQDQETEEWPEEQFEEVEVDVPTINENEVVNSGSPVNKDEIDIPF